MSVVADPRTQVACPGCQMQLSVPISGAGKSARCPSCQNTFVIQTYGSQSYGNPYGIPPQPERPPVATPPQNPFADLPSFPPAESMSARAQATSQGGSFAPEKAGLRAGVVGGLLMMALAAVWFFGGLAVGYIFFYPPILFIVGLVGLLKGIFDGNLAGGRHRR